MASFFTDNLQNSAGGSTPAVSPEPPQFYLTPQMISDLRPARTFSLNQEPVDSLAFSADGKFALTCSSGDAQMNLFDCERGLHLRSCNSKKYGCQLATFTHHPSAVLYSSTKCGHALRYLSLHENKFIRYFEGHEDLVTSLSFSPLTDTFISTAQDGLRTWDLRSPNATGIMSLEGKEGIVKHDTTGEVYAVAFPKDRVVNLFDARRSDAAFSSFILSRGRADDWTKVEFSRDGNTILLHSDGEFLQVIDAFGGKPLLEAGRTPTAWSIYGSFEPIRLDATFTPDGPYILATNREGDIVILDVAFKKTIDNLGAATPVVSGKTIKTLHSSEGPSAVLGGVIGFNPKYCMAITAAKNTAFWIPAHDWTGFLHSAAMNDRDDRVRS